MIRLLCTGDIHMGRVSTRLPGEFSAQRLFSTSQAWGRIVECALQEDVQALVLTGDVVDRENRLFEALGPLEAGLRRLADGGIDTFAVAGNHDFDVLPRLAGAVGRERFHLLGAAGNWERASLVRDGKALLSFDGWSFPERRFERSPLASYSLERPAGTPSIGLLHADLQQASSPYAPVRLDELKKTPHLIWLLGHVHQPILEEGAASAAYLYPGSPQAMDPGEPGTHGPWILEIEQGVLLQARQLPLSSVRYDPLELDLSGETTRESFLTALTRSMNQVLEARLQEGGGHLRILALRLRLKGRTRLHGQVGDIVKNSGELRLSREDAQALIEKVESETAPEMDLDTLCKGSDPLGILAGWLLKLEEGSLDSETGEMLDRTLEKVRETWGQPAFQGIEGDGSPDRETALNLLLRSGYQLIDELLRQRESV